MIDPKHPKETTGNTAGNPRFIAQAVYGDASLWYVIADANGLSGNQALQAGQTITLPNQVGGLHNTSSTFKVYDQSQVVGDMTPHMPTPPAKSGGGCGFKQLLVAIIAVVVAALTQGMFASLIGNTLFGSSTLASAASWGLAAATGSIVSQGAAIAMGIQEDFSWKQVGMAALGGAIGAGLGDTTALGGKTLGVTIARAAVTNALTQGIGVAMGLQEHFSWAGVAAAAVGAGIGHALGDFFMGKEQMGPPTSAGGTLPRLGGIAGALGGSNTAQLFAASLNGVAAGLSAAVVRGGRINAAQIASDAFGYVIGSSLAESMNTAGSQQIQTLDNAAQQSFRANEIRAQNTQAYQDSVYNQLLDAFNNAPSAGDWNPSNVTLLADAGTGPLGRYKPSDFGPGSGLEFQVFPDVEIVGHRSSLHAPVAGENGFLRQEAATASALYASGAGDVRDTSPAPGLLVDPATGLESFKYTSTQDQRLSNGQAIAVALSGGMGVPMGIDDPFIASGMGNPVTAAIATSTASVIVDNNLGPRTQGLVGTILGGYGVAAGWASFNPWLTAFSADQMSASAKQTITGQYHPTYLNQTLRGLGASPTQAMYGEVALGLGAGFGAMRAAPQTPQQIALAQFPGAQATAAARGTYAVNPGTSRSWKIEADNTYFRSTVEFDSSTISGSTGISYKVFQRADVEWHMVRQSGAKQGIGLTNAEAAARYGMGPVLSDGHIATLHHSQQSAVGPLFEASTRYHNIGAAQRAPLHPFGAEQNPYFPLGRGPGSLRDSFQRVDSIQYWKWRGKQEVNQ